MCEEGVDVPFGLQLGLALSASGPEPPEPPPHQTAPLFSDLSQEVFDDLYEQKEELETW
jgi:hypothetical protein